MLTQEATPQETEQVELEMAPELEQGGGSAQGRGGQSNDNESNDDTAEQQKLSLMRAYVECRDPSSKEVDDLMLRRFLRAHDLDVKKAAEILLKYLKWKKTFVPKGYISEEEIQYDLAHNKMFLGGVDKKGRPITVIFAGRHIQNTKPGGLDEYKRFFVYALDKICARMPPGQENFMAIADLQGWGFSNSDTRGYLGAISILQEYYPERLGKVLIVHSSRTLKTVWKLVHPFMDNKTKSKILFVENKLLKSTLLEEIDESQLPDVFGGKLPLVPIQDA